MKRVLFVAAAVIWAGLSISQAAEINQQGSYNFTLAMQDGTKGVVISRQVNERQFEKVSERLPQTFARASKQYQRRQAHHPNRAVRHCPSGGTFAPSNEASENQTGTGNQAGIVQFGTGDSATISQNGEYNAAYTLQTGNNLQANTTQSGDHNIALIIQRCR